MAAKAGVIGDLGVTQADADFALRARALPPMNHRLGFEGDPIVIEANAAIPVARFGPQTFGDGQHLTHPPFGKGAAPPVDEDGEENPHVILPRFAGQENVGHRAEMGGDTPLLATLKPLGQVRESFILAVNDEGLWIIDQHVAHERVLFEKVLHQRATERVESQRMLMPLIVELTPAQHAVFAEICDELQRNGFEVEPFGIRTIAVKTAPAGVDTSDVEKMLHELLDQFERERQAMNMETVRREIAASIACHAAIKINTPLAPDKMEWLIRELAKTECPMSCPHGRPVVLRYSVKDIQRAFKRI
jgi:DNA mismatch repair protein MutL